jgi:hypothetical protein
MSAKTLAAIAAALALAACGDKGDGTSIAINASTTEGNMVAGVDGNGQLAINLPGGFAGNIKLPKLKLDADDFDMNGVHLYPGSTISGMNVDASQKQGKDSGLVRISFQSPAAPSKVRDWFLDKLSKEAGFTIKASGNSLIGTTDERQPFRLELTPEGADTSRGTIAIGG